MIAERGPDVLLVLAIALSAVWALMNFALIASIWGKQRSMTVGLIWWFPSVALWIGWVIVR